MSGEEPGRTRVLGVDADLDMLFAQIRALRELAFDPVAAQDRAQVYDFSIRWGVLLSGRLVRLAHYHARGELTSDEQRRYTRARAELREVLPLADRLGLAVPAAVAPGDISR